MHSFFYKNNNKPTSNIIELSACEKSESTTDKFGIFSEIHDYFKDKYIRDWSHEDFYERTNHFFASLIDVMEDNTFESKKFFLASVKYRQHWERLVAKFDKNKPDVKQQVFSYFLAIAGEAHNTEKREALFYQRYLAREALLLWGKRVVKTRSWFDQFKEAIPLRMRQKEESIRRDTREEMCRSRMQV